MSGGHFGYIDENLMEEIYGASRMQINGRGYTQTIKEAIRDNPLEDRQMSELVFDVLCILHIFDWYKSCDSVKEEYKKDVKEFKQKWLSSSRSDRIKRALEAAKLDLSEYANDLKNQLNNIK